METERIHLAIKSYSIVYSLTDITYISLGFPMGNKENIGLVKIMFYADDTTEESYITENEFRDVRDVVIAYKEDKYLEVLDLLRNHKNKSITICYKKESSIEASSKRFKVTQARIMSILNEWEMEGVDITGHL